MRAMILAAGRGERMRPLTDQTPKPLLSVGGKPLIVWHIEKLAAAGIHDIVINHAWLGEQFPARLGHGERWGVRLHYSPESSALETAGGIRQALPSLGQAPFLVVNGDVWTDWNPQAAPAAAEQLRRTASLAWLCLVDNPSHHPGGDFMLNPAPHVTDDTPADDAPEHATQRLTFSGIGLYSPALFADLPPGQPHKLAPLLRAAMRRNQVIGTHFRGIWEDIGTPERLAALDQRLRASHSV
ncbi:MAG: nucleotidyltransferase family protein [Pigmentiphaga sp.]